MKEGSQAPAAVRVDVWCWAVRLFKTRSLATAACRAGHVRVNGERAKAAASVRIGDTVRARAGDRDRVLVVTGLITKRGSAGVAAANYRDETPAPPPRELAAPPSTRERGAGRPTKRERREIDRLRGR